MDIGIAVLIVGNCFWVIFGSVFDNFHRGLFDGLRCVLVRTFDRSAKF